MDDVDERTEEGEKLVPECEVTHKVETEKQSPSTSMKGQLENEPLLADDEPVIHPSNADIYGSEKKPEVKHDNVFMSTVGQAQKQQQQQQQQQQPQKQRSSGQIRIAVFIKKPIKKDRKSNDGNENMFELKLEKGKSTTAGEIKEKMLDILQIPKTSAHLFAIWFISPYLELQIKPHHKPFQLRKKWSDLLGKLSDCPEHEASTDEPVVVFHRNSFINVAEEKKQTEPLVLKRLFEEATFNFLNARYRMPVADALRLGGILLRLHEGEFRANLHQAGFFKNKGLKLSDFLPYYAIGSNKVSEYIHSSSTERRLLQQFQSPRDTLTDNLSCHNAFLEHCRKLPFYGSAFFKGSCLQEGVGYKMWKGEKLTITIAINCYGITLFKGECEEVLSRLAYGTFFWHYNKEEEVKQFVIQYEDNGQSRQIQIASNHASLMDAMAQSFVNVGDEEQTTGEEYENDLTKLNIISYISTAAAAAEV